MTSTPRGLRVLSLTALLAGCSSALNPAPPEGNQPSTMPGTGGRGDTPTGGGTGGSAGGTGGSSGSAASGGSGGTASQTPTGTGGTASNPGTGGAGGSPAPSDAAPTENPSPTTPMAGETPLPACKKSTPIADTAALAAAITAAQPGDCLLLADGSYTFPVITKTATEDAPIVIRAMNRGKAVVASGSIQLVKSAYVVIEGLDITSSGGSGMVDYGGSNGIIVGFSDSHHCRLSRSRIHPQGAVAERDWVVVTGESHHNRIDHNDLGPQNANANMIVIDGTGKEEPLVRGNVSPHNRVDHNYLHDINNTGGNNWEAIRVGRSWQGPSKGFNIIERNLLKGASGDPETISIKSSDNIVRYNTMRATSGEICLRHGNRSQVYGNYILAEGNGGSRGIRVYGADHRIYNNYIAAASTGIWLDAGSASATDEPGKEHYQVYRAWVFNNTLIGREIRVGGTKANPPRDCKIANNIATGGISAGGSGTVNEGNIVGGANPLTMEGGIFRLVANEAGARAIGKAVNASAYMITEDIDGQPRMEPDVGADEQSSAPVVFKGPLTQADVGPDAP